MSNIGRTIQDCFCNGFFGRNYSFEGARIEAEAYDWLVIRDREGQAYYANFNGHSAESKQEYIEEWCATPKEQ